MTRHRRHDPDEVAGDTPWRAQDYARPARSPDASGDYYAPPRDGRGQGTPSDRGLGTSGGHDDRPGEATGPPWEMPSWDEPGPPRRRPRDDGAHPSGPLPQVNSGPGYGSGEYPVPGGSGYDRSGGPGYDAGYDDPRHGGSSARGGHQRGGYGPPDDPLGGDYPTGAGYDDRPGYDTGPGYAEQGYPDEHGYAGGDGHPGADYPADRGYAGRGYPGDDAYPGQNGYAEEAGYPGQGGYPAGHDDGYPDQGGYPAGHDDGYPGGENAGYRAADDYLPGHDQLQPDHDRYRQGTGADPDDHGHNGVGWYDDVDEGQAWANDEDDSGLLPGLSGDGDPRHAPGRGPAQGRARRGRGGRRPAPPGRPRKRKSAMRRAAPWLALAVLAIVLGVAGAGFFYVWRTYLHPADYSGPGTGSVVVHIEPGETAAQVGQQLLNLGVVASVRAFSNAAKASGHGSSLEPGYYRLHKHMAATLAFALLLKPSSRVQLSVVIPEGMRLSEIIAALGKATGNLKGYQHAIRDVSALNLPSYAKGNPEGYLFPATYTVQPGTPPVQVLRAMVQRFKQEAQSVNLPAAAAHGQISQGDAIIVASLIQAEGRRPQDLQKIARVIYNRLNAKMALQLDTTVLYARHSRAADVTVAQTKSTKSAYNTYLHAGLPPGPIDSPGAAAIQAALHPAPPSDNWIYFLTVNPNTGLTKFTNSFAVFQTYEAQLAAYNASHH